MLIIFWYNIIRRKQRQIGRTRIMGSGTREIRDKRYDRREIDRSVLGWELQKGGEDMTMSEIVEILKNILEVLDKLYHATIGEEDETND